MNVLNSTICKSYTIIDIDKTKGFPIMDDNGRFVRDGNGSLTYSTKVEVKK